VRLRIRPELLVFLAPAFTLIIVFFVAPLILSFYVSFTHLESWDLRDMRLWTAENRTLLYNYYRLFYMLTHDPDMQKVVLTTIAFTFITLVLNVLGGLGLALAAYLIEERLSTLFRSLWLLPRLTPVAVYALLWYYFFLGGPQGTLNALLMALGVIRKPVDWGFASPPLGPWAVIIYVNALVGVSFGMIIFYSALKSVPWEHVIAARVDGASTLQVVRYILIPSLRWHIMFVTVWQLLSLLTTYAHIFLLVDWGLVDRWWSTTWSLYVFMKAFYTGAGETTDQGLAAAAATILVAIGAALGLITLRLMRFHEAMTEPRGEV